MAAVEVEVVVVVAMAAAGLVVQLIVAAATRTARSTGAAASSRSSCPLAACSSHVRLQLRAHTGLCAFTSVSAGLCALLLLRLSHRANPAPRLPHKCTLSFAALLDLFAPRPPLAPAPPLPKTLKKTDPPVESHIHGVGALASQVRPMSAFAHRPLRHTFRKSSGLSRSQ